MKNSGVILGGRAYRKAMRTGRQAGFTLMELLLVIVIIGILATIVLASLSNARTKASDVSVKGMMHNLRGAADQFYLSNGSSYGSAGTTLGSCAGPAAGSLLWTNAATNMSGLIAGLTSAVGANIDCGISSGTWSVAVKLPSGSYWCVDSTGKVGGSTAAGTTYTTAVVNAAGPHTTAGQTSCN